MQNIHLILYILIFEHLLLLVCQVLSTIWLFLMILLHYLCTFPLKLKSDTFTILSNFFAYVSTQFGRTVKSI
jgi:hypothetical protein